MRAPPTPSPSRSATEQVDRPDPGLARGKWEAPSALFYAFGALALLLVLVTFARHVKKRPTR